MWSTVGTAAGAVADLMGLRPPKVVMGPIVGFGIGTAKARRATGCCEPRRWQPRASSRTARCRRCCSADAQMSLLAERVRPKRAALRRPLTARTRYVGTDYVRVLAERIGGHYTAAAR